MTKDEHDKQIKRLLVTIDRLRAERDEWKGRWEAEHADHEATVKHANKMLAEDWP